MKPRPSVLERYRFAALSLTAALAFGAAKLFIHEACKNGEVCLEVLGSGDVVTRFLPSILAGAIFILGFLLAATIGDYKESERIPSELVGGLRSIYDDGLRMRDRQMLRVSEPAEEDVFSISRLRRDVLRVLETFRQDMRSQESSECVAAVDALSVPILEMEKMNLPPPAVTRLKSEQSTLRRLVLRAYHIQRSSFVPSAQILLWSIVLLTLGCLVLLRIEQVLDAVLLSVICYLFLYVILLLKILELPFRPQKTGQMDDVSLMLLNQFEQLLQAHAGYTQMHNVSQTADR